MTLLNTPCRIGERITPSFYSESDRTIVYTTTLDANLSGYLHELKGFLYTIDIRLISANPTSPPSASYVIISSKTTTLVMRVVGNDFPDEFKMWMKGRKFFGIIGQLELRWINRKLFKPLKFIDIIQERLIPNKLPIEPWLLAHQYPEIIPFGPSYQFPSATEYTGDVVTCEAISAMAFNPFLWHVIVEHIKPNTQETPQPAESEEQKPSLPPPRVNEERTKPPRTKRSFVYINPACKNTK